jgi:hypothetical protein
MRAPPQFGTRVVGLSEAAEFFCEATDFYALEHERWIDWNDSTLAIARQDVGMAPQLSAKEAGRSAFLGPKLGTD